MPEGRVRPAGRRGARHHPGLGPAAMCRPGCDGVRGPLPLGHVHMVAGRGDSEAGAATRRAVLPGGSDGFIVLKGKKPHGRRARGRGRGGPGLTHSWRALCHSCGHVRGRQSETLRLPTSADASTLTPRPGKHPRVNSPLIKYLPSAPVTNQPVQVW